MPPSNAPLPIKQEHNKEKERKSNDNSVEATSPQRHPNKSCTEMFKFEMDTTQKKIYELEECQRHISTDGQFTIKEWDTNETTIVDGQKLSIYKERDAKNAGYRNLMRKMRDHQIKRLVNDDNNGVTVLYNISYVANKSMNSGLGHHKRIQPQQTPEAIEHIEMGGFGVNAQFNIMQHELLLAEQDNIPQTKPMSMTNAFPAETPILILMPYGAIIKIYYQNETFTINPLKRENRAILCNRADFKIQIEQTL